MTQISDAETLACAEAGHYIQTPRSTATRYRDRMSYDRAAG